MYVRNRELRQLLRRAARRVARALAGTRTARA